MSRRFREQRLAAELESQGLAVLRTYHKDCPALVAIPRELLDRIRFINVKGENPSSHKKGDPFSQMSATYPLSEIRIEDVEPVPSNKLTDEQRAARAIEWEATGYAAYRAGLRRSEWPKNQFKPYTRNWYELRGQWSQGWDRAEEEANPAAHVHKAYPVKLRIPVKLAPKE